MKLNFEQYAVRLGERARPGLARASLAVIASASLACAHVVLAQTDNPPDAAASGVATPTNNPPAPLAAPIAVTPTVAAPLPTNSPPAAAVPGSTETNAPVVASAPVTFR